jgi:hypothetical protein
MAARDCQVQDNQLDGQVRSVSVQDCSQDNRINGNRCLESLSSAIHPAYGARDNEVRGNRIQTTRAEGEGLLQAYVGVSGNRFVDNDVTSRGRPRYLAYCGVHADSNEFRGNTLRGLATRACVAFESAWDGWSMNPVHYGHLKGPAINGFAREGSVGNRLIDNSVVGNGEAPALFLAQIGGADTPLRDCVIEANRLLGSTWRRQLELVEASAGQLHGLRFVGNRIPPAAQVNQFVLPRGMAHFDLALNNGTFHRLIGTRTR